MKSIKYIILLIFISYNCYSQEVLSFRNAVEKALLNNYSIRIAKVNQKIAQNNFSSGKAGMKPRIDVNAGYTYQNNEIDLELATGQRIVKSGNSQTAYNAGIQLNYNLFDGLAMFVNYDKLEELKNKSEIELQIAIENNIQNLANAYIQALKLQNSLKILKRNLEISNERLERLKIKNEFGNALQVELLKAEVDRNTDSANYLKTELAYKNAINNLNFIMGEKIEANFKVDESIGLDGFQNLNELRSLAANSNSNILRAIKNKDISELDKKLIVSSFLPRISLNLGYSINNQESKAGFILFNQTNGIIAGLNLNWNLYNGKQDEINRQNAELAVEISNITIEQIKSQIDLAIINNYETYKKREEILSFEKNNYKSAELNFLRTKELYELGQASSLDLRQAQINLSAQEIRIIEAELDYELSKIELSLLVGRKLF